MLREVREELGVDLESLEYAGNYWFGKKDMLMHGFIGFAHKQEFVLSEEIDSAEWVPAAKAPETMYPDGPGKALHELYRLYLKKKLTE